MTWTKLGDEFSDELANLDLSDAAFRTHVEAIAWLYRVERIDCHIPKKMVRRFVGSDRADEAIKELGAHGFWRSVGDFYEVVHHGDVIRASIVAQRNKRAKDKRNQAAARARAAAKESAEQSPADVSADADRQTDKQAATTATTSRPCGWCKSPDGSACGCLMGAAS